MFSRSAHLYDAFYDPMLLAVARGRLPGVPLHEGDMTAFDLGRRFDAVTCLFSSIAYLVASPTGVERSRRYTKSDYSRTSSTSERSSGPVSRSSTTPTA